MTFSGIPAEAFDFYEGLTADNSKAFWTAHKSEYESHVRGPLLELASAVEGDFGEAHLYRPYRDLRFSKDKTPYKDHQGMYIESRNGLGWYVQINVEGLMIAGGWYTSEREQLAHFRERIADSSEDANRLREYLAGIENDGFEVSGDRLRTRPRGVDADHPDLDLLRYKTIYAHRRWEPAAWMGTSDCLTRIVDGWRSLTPWMTWQAELVGPGPGPTAS